MNVVVGNRDGLGNRLEELVLLVALSRLNDERAVYIWNRSRVRSRNYAPRFRSQAVVIPTPIELKPSGLPTEHALVQPPEFRAAAGSLRLKLFPRAVDAVVHVRSTDRILRNADDSLHQHFMSEQMSKDILNRLVNMCASQFLSVHLVGDNPKLLHDLSVRLHASGVAAAYGQRTSAWQDFGLLVAARNVVMGSRFSSFVLMAAAVGHQLIYVPEETFQSDLIRYGNPSVRRY